MFKLLIGSFAAAVAMFFAGFLYFAGPLATLGYAKTGEAESATVQAALAANLPATGTYMIPNPATPSGTTLFGKGPVATISYNSNGFPLEAMDGMIWGFALYLVVAILLAGALSQLDRRVPDFRSRAIIVVCFSLAASALILLGNPIWMHHDWTYAIFTFVGYAFILCVGGLVLARWFLPTRAELPELPEVKATVPENATPPQI
jgi:hypothetical protein